MSEQISDKRKEAMARWVGFRFDSISGRWRMPAFDSWARPKYCKYLPDFPNDIAACFKWIAPELLRRGYGVTVGLDPMSSGYACVFQPFAPEPFLCFDQELSPAIAFFLAAEQLMKVEEGKDVPYSRN